MFGINNKVLLVEDSKEIYALVKTGLTGTVELTWCDTISKAKEYLEKNQPGLILLDIDLPDGNGVNYCQELQANKSTANIPVFFLTGHGDLSEKVMGFTVGADDYIVKPFVPLELRARVEARLKRKSAQDHTTGVYEWEKIKIDSAAQKVKITPSVEGMEVQNIELTALEFKILVYMAKSPETVIPRDDILNEVWGKDVHVYPRSVDTHVSKLRRKLGKTPSFIESVHGVGYKFVPQGCD